MTTLLEAITEKHRAQHEAELAHMRTPEFTGRIALAQKIADTLTADGFTVWPQVCWSSTTPDDPGIYLHIEIIQQHAKAGLRRLHCLLPDLAPGETEYTEGALSVELCPHANAHYHGWKPAEAAPQAQLSEAA